MNRSFLREIRDREFREYQEEQLRLMDNYVNTAECRRKNLLKYFNEEYEGECNNCDICKIKEGEEEGEREEGREEGEEEIIRRDYTVSAYYLMSIIKDLGGYYGLNKYIGIIRGSNAKNITATDKRSKYYGKGKTNSEKWWRNIVQILINQKYIREEPVPGGYGYMIECTKKSIEWIMKMNRTYNEIDETSDIDEEDKIILIEKKKTCPIDKIIKDMQVDRESNIRDLHNASMLLG